MKRGSNEWKTSSQGYTTSCPRVKESLTLPVVAVSNEIAISRVRKARRLQPKASQEPRGESDGLTQVNHIQSRNRTNGVIRLKHHSQNGMQEGARSDRLVAWYRNSCRDKGGILTDYLSLDLNTVNLMGSQLSRSTVKKTQRSGGKGGWRKQMHLCNGGDRANHPHRKMADFQLVSIGIDS